MSQFRTPLGRARGMGAAKNSVGRFIAERATGAGLVLLVIWGAVSALTVAAGGYDGAVRWLASPINAALLSLLAVTGFYHMQMGMTVIIEDYISKHHTRSVLLLLNAFACWAGMAVTVISLLKVALTGGEH